MRPTFCRSATMLSVLLLMAGCQDASNTLWISVSPSQPSAHSVVTIENRSSAELSYLTTLLDHPLDMWRLEQNARGQSPVVRAFAAFIVDEHGNRFLRCGLKDVPSPGPLLRFERLPSQSRTEFTLPRLNSYTVCMPKDARRLSWQIVYLSTRAAKNVRLSSDSAYEVLLESNRVEVKQFRKP